MKPILAAALTLIALFSTANAVATPISASSYQLTALTGYFAYGRTNWNAVSEFGVLNNVTQRTQVQTLLSDGYTAMNSGLSGQFNGIYAGFPQGMGTLQFAFNGGHDHVLDSLTFLSSRSYSAGTSLALQYALDGGAWQTASSTTAGALGITSGSAKNYTLSFGAVTADAFRLVMNGSQISLHELSIEKTASEVPEPVSLALFGFGLLGLAVSRRRAASK